MRIISFGLVLMTLVASACSQTVKQEAANPRPAPKPSPDPGVAEIQDKLYSKYEALAEQAAEIGKQRALMDKDTEALFFASEPTSRPTEKGSYLGAAVSEVPTVLRDQLKLQKNMGLVVNYVDQGSPAEAAGIRQSDVLQKLDDQILINTQQFAVLVRNHAPGPIKVTLIREARPMELSATLDVRDLPLLDDSGTMKYLRTLKPGPFGATFNSRRQFNLESKDADHSFTITSGGNGSRHLVAKDKSGKVIFDGPVDNDDQIKKLPAEIQPKVKELLARKSFPLNVTIPRFVPATPAPPAMKPLGSKSEPAV